MSSSKWCMIRNWTLDTHSEGPSNSVTFKRRTTNLKSLLSSLKELMLLVILNPYKFFTERGCSLKNHWGISILSLELAIEKWIDSPKKGATFLVSLLRISYIHARDVLITCILKGQEAKKPNLKTHIPFLYTLHFSFTRLVILLMNFLLLYKITHKVISVKK